MADNDWVGAWLEAGKGGYTTEQLQEAFKAVANPEHWKMDIDTVVDAKYRDILPRAIVWHTGGSQARVKITETIDPQRIHVCAPGYWSNGMDG